MIGHVRVHANGGVLLLQPHPAPQRSNFPRMVKDHESGWSTTAPLALLQSRGQSIAATFLNTSLEKPYQGHSCSPHPGAYPKARELGALDLREARAA